MKSGRIILFSRDKRAIVDLRSPQMENEWMYAEESFRKPKKMPKPPPELENFVSPGQLTNPFKSPNKNTPKARVVPPVSRGQSVNPFALKRKWPYYTTFQTESLLNKSIAEGQTTEEEVPMIMKLGSLVAQVLKHYSPTCTDVEYAIQLKNVEQMKKIISGEIEVKMPTPDIRHNSGMMNRQQHKKFWISLATAVLEKVT